MNRSMADSKSRHAAGERIPWCERPRPIVALAPMDGITDSAFRRIVRRIDRDVVLFSEFTNADGFLCSGKIRRRLDFTAEEQPYFVQLFGHRPESFSESAKVLEQLGVMGIDVNMGCPAKKIVASQHGSGLMRNVDLACRIVERVAAGCGLEISVKTRLGWRNADNLIPFAKSLESAGASLITVHGRAYEQGFSGKADWEPIYRLKRNLGIPVLGNGDVADWADGLRKSAGLDGFMIGRAAIGNPWVFRNNFRQNSVSWRERSALIAAHYRLMRETKAERACLLEFRKHLAEYVRGIADAKAVRQELFATRDEQTLLARIEALSGIDEQLPRAG